MGNEEKKSEEKDTKADSKWRQIVLETDGNSIRIVRANVAGNIELIGVLQSVINGLIKK